MKFDNVVYNWDLKTIETFVVKVLEAHTEMFDGCPPDEFPNPLEHSGWSGSLSTACRVIANSLTGTKRCPEGISIGDLMGDLSPDMAAATRAVMLQDFPQSERICQRAARRFVATYCTGEDGKYR